MKKLLILSLSIVLLAACDNNPFARKESRADNREKNEKGDREKSDGYDEKDNLDDETSRRKTDGYDNEDGTGSKWNDRDRDKLTDQCRDLLSEDGHARQICSCLLEKVEKKYVDLEDANDASDEETARMVKQCREDLGFGSGDEEDGYSNRRIVGNEDSYSSREGWTSLQRQQFIQGCATTAQRAQGFTAEQANNYCDCMTRKVERKFSFREAAKLTAQDLQTREWQEAAADCLSNY